VVLPCRDRSVDRLSSERRHVVKSATVVGVAAIKEREKEPVSKAVIRLKRLGRSVAVYGGIIALTLLLMDGVLIALGMFEPPTQPGHPTVGWISSEPSGSMELYDCWDPGTGEVVLVGRNELGFRTSHSDSELRADTESFEIAVSGDSHTDQCMTNETMHFGVFEEELEALGTPAAVFALGAGRYSPLQEYLAVRDGLDAYSPDAFVMNLYTGNDFYDILRVDDRPHFVRVGEGYEVAPPVWYQLDPPGERKRSRVLYAASKIADRIGVAGLWTRLRYLEAAAREQGGSLASAGAYLLELRKATDSEAGYPAAFAAQMLNQQLFLHRFAGSEDESIRRIRTLMELIRERYPEMLLVMSPIPSYNLVQEQPVDPEFLRVLEDLPITYESGVTTEARLFERLRTEAEAAGWMFIDNLTPLASYPGPERLYNDFDYHITLLANDIIGRNEAAAIHRHLSGGSPSGS